MKNGYTLINVIFVILIIGILTSVAAPHLNKLKQNAHAYSVIKVAISAFSSIPSVYVNIVDVEKDYNEDNITLQNLIGISGNGWLYLDENTTIYEDHGNRVVTIELNTRDVNISIDCQNFIDKITRDKCEYRTDNDPTKPYYAEITF